MGRSLWDTASGRDRRWVKRRHAHGSAPRYVRVVVVVLALALVGTLGWQGIQALLHRGPKYSTPQPSGSNRAVRNEAAGGNNASGAWESGLSDALQAAAAQGSAGNVTAAEVEVDRAASIVMSARMAGQKASADFYSRNVAALDRALKTQPDDSRLFEHVTLARIELANFRSAERASEPGAGGTETDDAPNLTTYPGAAATPLLNVGPDAEAPHAKAVPGHVLISAPRAMGAGSVLDAGTLGGDYLDATLMPETSEVLLPPSNRNFSDSVRVEGLTIEGASQTLDGVRWKNVTFVGMRLRYEGGQVSLQNVKFIRCRFGFTTDERGAKLADAVALGKTSIEIQ